MTIRIEIITHDVEEELDRLDHLASTAVAGLEAVLATAFAATQAAVHVRTGSLKLSGDVQSMLREGVWHGSIQYGGAAPGGIHNPVVYAWFEARRGETHDFLAPAALLDAAYGQVILRAMKGV